MNLPQSLLNLFVSSLTIFGFYSSAMPQEMIAAPVTWEANSSPHNLLAQDAPNCNSPRNQLEINICSLRDYEAVDKRLNQVYQQLPAQMRSRLTQPQLAWIEFRDTNCDFAIGRFEAGSIVPTILYQCLGRMTEQRTSELQTYRSGQIPLPTSINYQQVDRELNQTYQRFMNQLNSALQNKLITAQLAWIEFRDTNCAFKKTQVRGGEYLCKIRMTEQRTQELAQFMSGLY